MFLIKINLGVWFVKPWLIVCGVALLTPNHFIIENPCLVPTDAALGVMDPSSNPAAAALA
jgi:hypothetical protein